MALVGQTEIRRAFEIAEAVGSEHDSLRSHLTLEGIDVDAALDVIAEYIYANANAMGLQDAATMGVRLVEAEGNAQATHEQVAGWMSYTANTMLIGVLIGLRLAHKETGGA
jgi:hypothetical protein